MKRSEFARVLRVAVVSGAMVSASMVSGSVAATANSAVFGDVKDICRCSASTIPDADFSRLVYFDSSCSDLYFEYKNISDKDECEAKNGRQVDGYYKDLGDNSKCKKTTGELQGCILVAVPDASDDGDSIEMIPGFPVLP